MNFRILAALNFVESLLRALCPLGLPYVNSTLNPNGALRVSSRLTVSSVLNVTNIKLFLLLKGPMVPVCFPDRQVAISALSTVVPLMKMHTISFFSSVMKSES